MSSRSFTLVGDATERSTGSFAGILVCAGLLNALVAAFLLCRLPQSTSPSLIGLLFRASLYVCGVAAAGAGGTWFYWRRSSSSSRMTFSRFLQVIWPGVRRGVGLGAGGRVADDGAVASCRGNRGRWWIHPFSWVAKDDSDGGRFPRRAHWSDDASERELFADSLQAPVLRLQGYGIAICVYAAALAPLRPLDVYSQLPDGDRCVYLRVGIDVPF